MRSALFVDGRKFMWDGRTYESHEAANTARQAYEADGFEAHIHVDEGKFFVYTRRVAAQTAAEASEAQQECATDAPL